MLKKINKKWHWLVANPCMFLIVYVANNRPPACPKKLDNYIIYVLTLSVIDLQVFVYTQE